MSAPIDDQGFSDALRYAPPWARRTVPETSDGDLRTTPAESAVDAAGTGFDAADDAAPAGPARSDAARDDTAPADVSPADVPLADVPLADVSRGHVPSGDVPHVDVSRGDVPNADGARAAIARPDRAPAPVAPGGAGPEVILGVRFGEAPGLPQDLDALAAAPARARQEAADRGVEAAREAGQGVGEAAVDRVEPVPAPEAAAADAAPLPRAPALVAPPRQEEQRPPAVWLVAETAPIRTEPPRQEPPPIVDSPAMVPSPGDPGGFGWLKPRPFEGDVAVRELSRRLALDPHGVPEPPRPDRLQVPWRGAVALAALAGVSAAVALALVTVLFPGPVPAGRDQARGPVLASAKSDRALMAGLERAAPVRLVLVELRRAARGEEVPLGITLTRGLGEGALVLTGLLPGTRLTVGMPAGPEGWRVPLGELGRAAIVPPDNFVGSLDLGLELRLADDTVGDRGTMRIEWSGAVIMALGAEGTPVPVAPVALRGTTATPPGAAGSRPLPPGPAAASVPAIDPEEIAILVDRGKTFLARGDLAAARLLLRRAAEAGDAAAALLLGSTFDPAALKQLEVLGAVGDAAQARIWYRRAAELGSADAARKLGALGERAP